MKVYIAVDSSDISEKACKWYLDNMHKDENEVVIAHHAEQPKLPTLSFDKVGSFPAGEISKIMTDHNRKIADLEHKFTMIAKNYKNCKVSVQTTEDSSPGHAICKAAAQSGAAMIVIGSRGLGVIKRKILGSVSDYVLHHSDIPVCICPL